jgi:hypothetical protein
MIMGVVLDDGMWAKLKAAEVDISVHVKATINVTPFVARQKVNVFLLDKVGTGLLADAPNLMVVGQRLQWRVPVILSLPGHGRLGQIGVVDVDVQTGEILANQSLITDLTNHANQLAASSPL